MSNRLDKIAELIQEGRGVIDVGTDHGYIPVMLCGRGYAGNIIAADINEAPLGAAKRAAGQAGFEDSIAFCLTDGLAGIASELIDTIVIAGMGGDTITGILDRDYWCCQDGYKLILQPMSHQNVLRYWLVYNEFEITAEYLVKDGGNIYEIMEVQKGEAPNYRDAEFFTGKYESASKNALFPEKLSELIKKFTSRVSGMESGKSIDDGLLRLNRTVLGELKLMQRRYEND